MNRKKVFRKKKILIAIIICIIILMILSIILIVVKKDNSKALDNETEKIEIRGLDNVYPNGTFYFSQKYNGKLEMNKISTQVSKYITSSIPTLRKNLKDKTKNEIVDYYNSNLDDVKKLVGNISEGEFVDLINNINTFNSEDLNYLRSEYDYENCTREDDEFKIDLQIEYENEKPLLVTIKINDKYRSIKLISK